MSIDKATHQKITRAAKRKKEPVQEAHRKIVAAGLPIYRGEKGAK